jgi:hypothetical protein
MHVCSRVVAVSRPRINARLRGSGESAVEIAGAAHLHKMQLYAKGHCRTIYAVSSRRTRLQPGAPAAGKRQTALGGKVTTGLAWLST